MISFFRFTKVIFIFYFFTIAPAAAISGKDINSDIKFWLKSKGYESNPEFLENKILPDCENKIILKKHFNSFKLVNVSCEGLNSWSVFVKTNVNLEKINNEKSKNNYKVIKLSKSLEKGEIITIDDLTMSFSSNNNYFFKNKKDLIGRKLKQNLREGQIVRPRHLFKKYYVNEGEPVLIESKLQNATVSTSGVAMESGNLGDILRVKNVRSGRIIKGYLKKNKKINVFF